MQSFKYFITNKKYILEKFAFHPHLLLKAENKLKSTFNDKERIPKKIVLAHVRRGDFLHQDEKSYGYVVVEKDYILSAFNRIISSNQLSLNETALFLVSDDFKWIKKEFKEIKYATVLKTDANEAVDLALSKYADYVIISTGTFSWWFGFFKQHNSLSTKKILCRRTL